MNREVLRNASLAVRVARLAEGGGTGTRSLTFGITRPPLCDSKPHRDLSRERPSYLLDYFFL
jgi:hypothetical protein